MLEWSLLNTKRALDRSYPSAWKLLWSAYVASTFLLLILGSMEYVLWEPEVLAPVHVMDEIRRCSEETVVHSFGSIANLRFVMDSMRMEGPHLNVLELRATMDDASDSPYEDRVAARMLHYTLVRACGMDDETKYVSIESNVIE